jgi:gluconate 2-dehydrogenase gamma chain
MNNIARRDLLRLLLAAPLSELALGIADIERAVARAEEALAHQRRPGQQYRPRHFDPRQWRTVRILADMVIPRDGRSGSASDAGVPEFMDFMLGDRPALQSWMYSGLAWLDREAVGRFGQPFAECGSSERRQLLDLIAWPQRAPAEVQEGVRFFNNFRNLTASGFWSSKMGLEDLRYMGNQALAAWEGCPPAVLRKLGVSYGG